MAIAPIEPCWIFLFNLSEFWSEKALPHPNFRLSAIGEKCPRAEQKNDADARLARVGDERFFGWSPGVGLQQTR
jgi:hypothetical protein